MNNHQNDSLSPEASQGIWTPSAHVTILFFSTPENVWIAHCPEFDFVALGCSIEQALSGAFSAIRIGGHIRVSSRWESDFAEARACLTINPNDVCAAEPRDSLTARELALLVPRDRR